MSEISVDIFIIVWVNKWCWIKFRTSNFSSQGLQLERLNRPMHMVQHIPRLTSMELAATGNSSANMNVGKSLEEKPADLEFA